MSSTFAADGQSGIFAMLLIPVSVLSDCQKFLREGGMAFLFQLRFILITSVTIVTYLRRSHNKLRQIDQLDNADNVVMVVKNNGTID